MPRTQDQYEVIRKKRKIQIMESALQLFASEGYGHVSISSLAAHAGISKGLMYNYFKSKEDLLQQVIDFVISEVLEHIDPNNDGVLTQEEFKLFIRKTFELMREKAELYTQFFSLVLQPNVSDYFMKSPMITHMGGYFEMFHRYFIEQGFEDPQLEVLQLSALIEGLGVMLVFYSRFSEMPEKLFDKLEERIIHTYTSNENK